MYASGRPVLGVDINEDSFIRHEQFGGRRSSLEEVMREAIATTGVPGLIPPESVRQGQIIFALSNPDAEILPSLALESGAALAADGTTVNNVLGYPGIWRGALTTGASTINTEMLIAAAEALAQATHPGELSPSPIDIEVHRNVAYAVGRAAVESGVGDTDSLS